MTNEEAIAVLKEKYCGIGSNDLFIFRKAIEALEKQIPKKPVKSVIVGLGYECPTCGAWAGSILFDKFCDKCGQALDWSETE